MIIDKNTYKYLIHEGECVSIALEKISRNKHGAVFVVNESNQLTGILTDGDFRRWIINCKNIDLSTPVVQIFNRNFFSMSKTSSAQEIESHFSDKIRIVPLVDENHNLYSVACSGELLLEVENKVLSQDSPAFIIAEIGNNHNGDLELAKHLVDLAKDAGADCVKFQMRQMDKLYRNNDINNSANEDLGTQYTLDLLSRFMLKNEELLDLFDYCKKHDIIPMCTPWDIDSVDILEESGGVAAYKIASADLTNHDLLQKVADTKKIIFLSTGMSTEKEIIESAELLHNIGAGFVLLHCNSTYPAPFKDVNLSYLTRLSEIGSCMVGYSGHERDINVAIASVALGSKVLEKHLTVNRNMEGNDHKVSLLPDEFKSMVVGVRQVEEAIGSSRSRSLSQGELINRENLAKSIVAADDIKKGDILTRKMLMIRSPGQGLQPNKIKELLGRKSIRSINKGEFFFSSDLSSKNTITARHYSFNRPWGIPVRFHDVKELSERTNLGLLEFHLSYKDIDLDPRDFLSGSSELDYIVHCPELFEGDHVLNLCSFDTDYRNRSIYELQRIVDLTRKLKPYFNNATFPMIVTNMGGFSLDNFFSQSERKEMYLLLTDSLKQIDTNGVEIIPQTMPPFPWHFGGQRYHNLFVDSDSIVVFCKKNNMRVCFDLSHSQLACNHYRWSFDEFIKKIGKYVAHMHIADASGVDGEGIQLGEGNMDYTAIGKCVNEFVAPTASFIPEVWQGHKNQGSGFWEALEYLESLSLY